MKFFDEHLQTFILLSNLRIHFRVFIPLFQIIRFLHIQFNLKNGVEEQDFVPNIIVFIYLFVICTDILRDPELKTSSLFIAYVENEEIEGGGVVQMSLPKPRP